jgi:hypothetical protein
MSDETKTLYERLGGYDAITAVANDLLPRLQADPQLGPFWAHRGEDGVKREKQLLIDFPLRERGRTYVLSRQGHGAYPPRHAHQRARLERVPRSCRRDPGEVPGATSSSSWLTTRGLFPVPPVVPDAPGGRARHQAAPAGLREGLPTQLHVLRHAQLGPRSEGRGAQGEA